MAPFIPPWQSKCYILPLYGLYTSSLTNWFDYCENKENNELLQQKKTLEYEQMPIPPAKTYCAFENLPKKN